MKIRLCPILVFVYVGCSNGGNFVPKRDAGAQSDLTMALPDGAVDMTPTTCKNANEACAQGDNCCNGLVCNGFDGVCEKCGQNGARCTTTGDCCNGVTCNLQTNFCGGGPPVDMGPQCGGQGAACAATLDCCQGYYCVSNTCTNTPSCKPIAGSCNSADVNGYMVCCDSMSMDCIANKCCIEKMYQDKTMVRCYGDGDCCNAEKCLAGACT